MKRIFAFAASDKLNGEAIIQVTVLGKNIVALSVIILCVIFAPVCCAKVYEKDYNSSWCSAQNGVTEYRTKDNSRVDCLTKKEYAVECDYAYKWKEAVGQSLFYAVQTDKKPAILLIVKDFAKEQKYIDRLNIVAQKYDIKVWHIMPDDL